jgi:serine protease Do
MKTMAGARDQIRFRWAGWRVNAAAQGASVFLLSLIVLNAATPAASAPVERLPRNEFKNGAATLSAFGPLASQHRFSVAKVDVDGATVALATVIDATGLAVTKSSELRPGELTCWLPGGHEAPAEVLAVDDESDLALIRIRADGLKPISWSAKTVAVGEWAITLGIEEEPFAVGIISSPPRRILHPRALIGVSLDFRSSAAKIQQLIPGLGAARAGLQPGDIILAVDETLVEGPEELISLLRHYRDGQTTKLRVQRADERFEVSVRLEKEAAVSSTRGYDRQARMDRMGGDLSRRAEGFDLALQHDTVLPPWLCGGPLLNLAGEAIGVNIARAGRVATLALPTELVLQKVGELRRKSLTSDQ